MTFALGAQVDAAREDASPAGVGHCSAAPRSARLAGGGWLDVDFSAAAVEDVSTSHLLRGVV
ncbi:MAG TPA: hypothetical protein VII16_01135 [Actinomycetes bacterium]